MRKIIRLTESDLIRLVKRVINEQPIPPTGLVGDKFKNAINKLIDDERPLDSYKGKTVNFYLDKENRKFLITGKIINFYREGNGKIILDINFNERNSKLKFNCAFSNNGFEEVSGKLKSNVYSNSLSDELKREFCMKNKSGVPVPKADFASTNDSQNDLS